jgi:hypothetical protein
MHNLKLGNVSICQICNSKKLNIILDLGFTPPCDSLPDIKKLNAQEISYPLKLLRCSDCCLLQLSYVVDPKVLFHVNYPYKSSITKVLSENLQNGAKKIIERLNIKENSLVVDIGSNDGTFLKGFQKNKMKVLGVEPTNISKIAIKENIPTIQSFFDKNVCKKILSVYGAPKLVTATNMFAHVQMLGDLIKGVENLLQTDGYFVSESHYALDILKTLQFDSIYHEHLKYYSLKDLIKLFSYYNFTVIDAERIPNYGGSIRCYAQKGKNRKVSKNINALLKDEDKNKLYDESTWLKFSKKVEDSKKKFKVFISDILKKNKTLCGVGSPGRSCTLINYFDISKLEMGYIAEQSSSLKLGLYMPGKHIPIIDEKIMLKKQPDYVLLLSWHYYENIVKNLRNKGLKSKIIIPLPEIKVLS